jgi:hypothetical protein
MDNYKLTVDMHKSGTILPAKFKVKMSAYWENLLVACLNLLKISAIAARLLGYFFLYLFGQVDFIRP